MAYRQNWRGYWFRKYPNFTKLRKFQKNLYANLKLLNYYGSIIPIKTNKKAYVRVCFIFKIGDTTRIQIHFPSLVHALKWERRIACF